MKYACIYKMHIDPTVWTMLGCHTKCMGMRMHTHSCSCTWWQDMFSMQLILFTICICICIYIYIYIYIYIKTCLCKQDVSCCVHTEHWAGIYDWKLPCTTYAVRLWVHCCNEEARFLDNFKSQPCETYRCSWPWVVTEYQGSLIGSSTKGNLCQLLLLASCDQTNFQKWCVSLLCCVEALPIKLALCSIMLLKATQFQRLRPENICWAELADRHL